MIGKWDFVGALAILVCVVGAAAILWIVAVPMANADRRCAEHRAVVIHSYVSGACVCAPVAGGALFYLEGTP